MSKPEQRLNIALAGDIADWLQQEATRNTRTPSQHAAHLLMGIKTAAERRKQTADERKEKRKGLGFYSKDKAA